MFSPENPEAKKEYAKEVLRKAVQVTLEITEGEINEEGGNETLAQYQQEYFNVTGNELTPDMIVDAIDESAGGAE